MRHRSNREVQYHIEPESSDYVCPSCRAIYTFVKYCYKCKLLDFSPKDLTY